MEPLKINIEVSLSDRTLETLRNCVTAVASTLIIQNVAENTGKIPAEEAPEMVTVARAAAASIVTGRNKAVSGPQTKETEKAPAPAGEAAPAAPEAPTEEPQAQAAETPAEISDPDLRAVVQQAKKRVGAQAIRAVFAKFNIEVSIDCPQERRAELVDELNALK